MAEAIKFTFTKLNNGNYYSWKWRMQLLLIKEKTWNVISEAKPNPVTDEWRSKNASAYATIGLNVEDDQSNIIRSTKTAKEAWDALNKYHMKSSANSKVRLLKNLMVMQLDEGGDMELHIARINDIFHQLVDDNKKIELEDLKVATLLGSLPESYGNLVMSLESREEADLTTNIVQAKLIDEYKRRQYKSGLQCGDSALKVTKGKLNQNKGRVCFFCHKAGHFKSDCMKYKSWLVKQGKSDKGQNEKKQQKANLVNDGEYLFTVYNDGSKLSWMIDSGATSHVTSNKKVFSQIVEGNLGKVRVANGKYEDVKGKGTVRIEVLDAFNNVKVLSLSDVLWVPAVPEDLISVRKLQRKGCQVLFTEDERCEISYKGHVVALGDLCNNLYELRQPNKACMAHNGHPENCIHRWHEKCGHRDIEVIKRLNKEKLVEEVKIVDCGIDETCGVCQEGKLTKTKFPKVATKHSLAVMDLVHTDLCGPMQTKTPSKKSYILTFIDDHTKYTVIYLLQHKSETFSKLQEYVEMCLNMFGRKPKFIRSDRGGEHTGNEVVNYLKKNGIQIEYTVPHNPQQNGVAERKNRTLVEMSRCMLFGAGLPNTFWGEAVNMANHIQNRLPTKAAEVTPFEGWFKRKPNIQHFEKFGAKCYVHIEAQKRQKLDAKSFQAVLVGYDEQSKGYRCYNPKTERVVISRDVRFVINNETEITVTTSEGVVDRKVEGESEKQAVSETKATSTEFNGGLMSNNSFLECNQSGRDCHNETRIDGRDYDESESGVRRSSRTNKGVPPQRYSFDDALLFDELIPEPKSFNEAMNSSFKVNWLNAMKGEINSLEKNDAWKLTDLPPGRKAIGCKWVYKVKYNPNGSVQRFKARLVAQGYSQKFGEDYDRIFAPVVKPVTFRTLLAIAAKEGLNVIHMDAETAFLNGSLKETIYMKQPPGFIVDGKEDKVCHLFKSLYGLKQSARSWNTLLHDVLISADFQQCEADPCLYKRKLDDSWCYVLIYVDDIIVSSKEDIHINDVYKVLSAKFSISNLGPIKQYLGWEIARDKNGIYSISQMAYIQRVIADFGMSNAKISNVPLSVDYGKDPADKDTHVLIDNEKYQQLIGCLLYVCVSTRPDISASVSILGQKTNKPTQADYNELKRVLRYLKGTTNVKLSKTGGNVDDGLIGFADANWAEDRMDRKSNSGYVFFVNGFLVSWSCKKQNCVAMSSTEAEFISLSEACKEAIWLRKLLADFNLKQNQPTVIYEDNQSCLSFIKEEQLSARTKHIDTKVYFVKDHIEAKDIVCVYCPTEIMLADLLTKPLPAKRIQMLRLKCGLNE